MSSTKLKLTDDQQQIHDSVIHNVKTHQGRFDCVVQGYAGTGKSTTISRIINSLYNMGTIAITSPTHKANSVLKRMLEKEGVDSSDVMTIHSFLGLKLVNKKRQQVLEHDPHSPNAKKLVDVLIVDECSMISTDLYMHLVKQAHRIRRAIIFVGDECQLPPVEPEKPGTVISCSFQHGEQFALVNVLRQALDNPITALATDIRACIDNGESPLRHIYNVPSDCPTIIKANDFYSYADTYIATIIGEDPKFDMEVLFDGVDRYKMISYTNRNVDTLNNYVRGQLIGSQKEFVKGEPIVFDEAVLTCPYSNQQVIKCPEVTQDIWMGIECWRFENHEGVSVYMVGPQSKYKYYQHLENIVTQINLKATNPYTKKPYNWGDYYILKEKMNVVSYPYAQTYHKSQGSTYDVVWMDLEYVTNVRDNADMARMLYTAVTRPREALIVKQ